MTIRAITLHREWAYAVQYMDKRIENRPFVLSDNLLPCRLAIHAGANIGDSGSRPATRRGLETLRDTAYRCHYTVEAEKDGRHLTGRVRHRPHALSTRMLHKWSPWRMPERFAIVAIATVKNILPPVPTDERWRVADQHGWVLDDLTVLRHPIRNVKGRQGVWNASQYTTAIEERVTLSHGFTLRSRGLVDFRGFARGALAEHQRRRHAGFAVHISVTGTDRDIKPEDLLRFTEREEQLDRRVAA